MTNKSTSLRDKVREFERTLTGEAAKVFRETYNETAKSTTVKKAFSAAKKAVDKLPRQVEV